MSVSWYNRAFHTKICDNLLQYVPSAEQREETPTFTPAGNGRAKVAMISSCMPEASTAAGRERLLFGASCVGVVTLCSLALRKSSV